MSTALPLLQAQRKSVSTLLILVCALLDTSANSIIRMYNVVVRELSNLVHEPKTIARA